MAFVIAVDSQIHPGETLFMVDRNLRRDTFWSTNLECVFVFRNRFAAEVRCSKYKFNNPRVMTLREAKALLELVPVEDNDPSWDAHKIC
jgi:hypothetical protein